MPLVFFSEVVYRESRTEKILGRFLIQNLVSQNLGIVVFLTLGITNQKHYILFPKQFNAQLCLNQKATIYGKIQTSYPHNYLDEILLSKISFYNLGRQTKKFPISTIFHFIWI